MSPKGYRYAALASGIKKSGKLDLGLILSETPANCAGVFTQNLVIAAPLQVTKPRIALGKCQAILVNSGNANACTGASGLKTAEDCVTLTARALGLDPDLVAVASTGVIGQPMPLEPFVAAMPKLVAGLETQEVADVARAMMTTDRYTKISCVNGSVAGTPYTLLGVAKGAGMIHPNMATMLGFVVTDAALGCKQLQRLLKPAVDNSFNAITVDGDTSTNDLVLLLANGASGAEIKPESDDEKQFAENLLQLLLDLAKMIVRDGEGATKLAEIKVVGAQNPSAARSIAKTVATSSLVKTAFFGEDANWGRIIAAVGYAGVEINPDMIDILFDQVMVASAGLYVGPHIEAPATAVLKQAEFCVTIDLHQGDATASYYTSDLTYDYVKINADYRS
ncbi:bifunctional glutamate N-acetyltransferase/amino-acid acetyltransferase ArgJ [Geopsychrobacter electrodiphilus]|uniref:bifunctional glutamate N-acetyltransferase/amino-acid acetyltransferase ArgJ n=1 Tax=Geopsychrobacter electrodiphilus TaxID=225196 RepID=UPI0004758C57